MRISNRWSLIVGQLLLTLCVKPAICQSTLLAQWDGTSLQDQSGNHNDLSNQGATYGPGLLHSVFELDGQSHLTNSNPNFQLTSADFTINLWAKFDSYSVGNSYGIPNTLVAQDEGANYTPKFAFYYNNNTNSIGFHVNSRTGNPFYFDEVAVPTAPKLGSWNMWTVTGNTTSNTLSFYDNGVFIGKVDGARFSTPNAPITIGEAEGLGYWKGGIGDIGLYRGELSGSQILDLYNAESVPEPASGPSLVLFLASSIAVTSWVRLRQQKKS